MVSARKARLQHAAEPAASGARVALELKRDPGRFLSTVQIGITVIGVLASVLGGATLADTLAHVAGLRRRLAGTLTPRSISFVVVVIAISYLTLIFGELVPKRIALEPAGSHRAAPCRAFCAVASLASRPVEWLLSASSNLVLRLVPLRADEPPPVTEEEITIMLREARRSGISRRPRPRSCRWRCASATGRSAR